MAKNGLMGLLRENGGKYIFGDSWAQQFFERHDMVLRVCPSKMREHPAEFEVGRDYIFKYKTPAIVVVTVIVINLPCLLSK